MLCYVMLCYIILYYVILYYVILYYASLTGPLPCLTFTFASLGMRGRLAAQPVPTLSRAARILRQKTWFSQTQCEFNHPAWTRFGFASSSPQLLQGATPNLPTKVIPAKTHWLKISRKFPMDMRIPPLEIKILPESSEIQSLSSEIGRTLQRPDSARPSLSLYNIILLHYCFNCNIGVYIYIYVYLSLSLYI